MTNLADLKSRINLPELAAEYVALQRRGKTLWGRCPFHDERTASFAVHPEYFHCHGCAANGDAIDFFARMERVSKGRAIRLLAERYGVPTGPLMTRRESAYMRDLRAQAEFWWADRRRAAMGRLQSACARYFADQTTENEARAAAAGAYLRLLDSIDPAIRGRAFVKMRTDRDYAAWMESKMEYRNLAAVFGVRV